MSHTGELDQNNHPLQKVVWQQKTLQIKQNYNVPPHPYPPHLNPPQLAGPQGAKGETVRAHATFARREVIEDRSGLHSSTVISIGAWERGSSSRSWGSWGSSRDLKVEMEVGVTMIQIMCVERHQRLSVAEPWVLKPYTPRWLPLIKADAKSDEQERAPYISDDVHSAQQPVRVTPWLVNTPLGTTITMKHSNLKGQRQQLFATRRTNSSCSARLFLFP